MCMYMRVLILIRIFLEHQNITAFKDARKFHISTALEYIADEYDNVAAPCELPINAWHRRQLCNFCYVAIGYEWFLSLSLTKLSLILNINSFRCWIAISRWSYFPESRSLYNHFANFILILSISLSISSIVSYTFYVQYEIGRYVDLERTYNIGVKA